MNTARSFGEWLRQRRRALDLTQEELAQQVGCSAITLRKLEAEERRPSKQIAERLAEVLQVTPDDRADFLRFARGDPFAGPATPKTPDQPEPHETPHHNLPSPLTRFIGREREIGEIKALLGTERLVILTGTGGTGKTRLAQQVAVGLLDAFPDGAWQVELASLHDPALVPQVIANGLGLREMPGLPITAVLLDHLRPKRLLLLLDNCEHLIQVCAELAEMLLRACPQLSILATSREGLGITGVSAYLVPSLSLPDASQRDSIETLNRSEAARLFVERASTVLPGFALTNDNAPAVAEICRQLDGIPLAIELAAARVRVLRVEQIVALLDDRFRLLTSGSRTALHRHQTLQALIDWSYDLLSEPERILFRCLAVFVGGWTFEAAEAVGNGEDFAKRNRPARSTATPIRLDTLDLLAQLANKSLVMIEHKPGTETRYRMLETIRQYALAKLEASGEADEVRQRHTTFYVALAEPWDQAPGPPPPAWLDALYSDHDNLRAALARAQLTVGSAELGLRLALATTQLWAGHGYWSEGRGWLEAALARAEGEQLQNAELRPWALNSLAHLAGLQGDYAAAQARGTESLRLFRELGNQRASAHVLCQVLGWSARERGDAATARLRLEEGLALFRELGEQWDIAWGLVTLGGVAVMQEDTDWATALLEEGLSLSRAQQVRPCIPWALNHLGHVAQIQGEYERAARLHNESLPLFRASAVLNLGNLGAAWAYHGLGETALAQGDAALAATHLTNALAFFRDLGDRAGTAWCLAGLAGVAVLEEQPERAAWLWGAAAAQRQAIGARDAPASRATRERLMAMAREQLGEAAFAAAWTAGETASLAEAIERALQSEAEA
jgi:predicted ATPase/DNA-binding XRE family transcriptional regulator